MVLLILSLLSLSGIAALADSPSKAHPVQIHNASVPAKSFLNNKRSAQTQNMSFTLASGPTCKCMPSNPTWSQTSRTSPKCIFIDLGAANGNTFEDFLNDRYGPVKNCAHGTGDYEAFLVEANPRFANDLTSLQKKYPQKVHALPSTAAYMCEGTTTFYLDTVTTEHNYWGSSMSANHQDVQKSGAKQKVTVPTSNLMKILSENTIPDDYVIVKMDIEGAEWDILPCLAESPLAKKIDRLYLEQHPSSWSVSQPAEDSMPKTKAKLANQGVDMPGYFSNTF